MIDQDDYSIWHGPKIDWLAAAIVILAGLVAAYLILGASGWL